MKKSFILKESEFCIGRLQIDLRWNLNIKRSAKQSSMCTKNKTRDHHACGRHHRAYSDPNTGVRGNDTDVLTILLHHVASGPCPSNVAMEVVQVAKTAKGLSMPTPCTQNLVLYAMYCQVLMYLVVVVTPVRWR